MPKPTRKKQPTKRATPQRAASKRAKAASKRTVEIRIGRWLIGFGLLVIIGLSAWAVQQIPYQRTLIVGTVHAEEGAIQSLIGADSIQFVYNLEPEIIADRVVRHPWVRQASATRWPTGTLVVSVTERTPVALALDPEGRPDHYLDADGFRMPLADGVVYDVPLMRGLREAYHPVRPVEEPGLREWLALLPTLPVAVDALISDLEYRRADGWWLYAVPPAADAAIPVRMGRADFAAKMDALYTMWHREIVPRPDTRFEWIDLRFEGQVITKEAAGS